MQETLRFCIWKKRVLPQKYHRGRHREVNDVLAHVDRSRSNLRRFTRASTLAILRLEEMPSSARGRP